MCPMSSSRPWLFSHAIKSRIRKIALTRPSPPLRSSLRGQSARYRALLRRPGQLHLRLGGSSRPRHGPPYPLTFPLRLVVNEHALFGDGERPPYGHGPWLPCGRTQTRHRFGAACVGERQRWRRGRCPCRQAQTRRRIGGAAKGGGLRGP